MPTKFLHQKAGKLTLKNRLQEKHPPEPTPRKSQSKSNASVQSKKKENLNFFREISTTSISQNKSELFIRHFSNVCEKSINFVFVKAYQTTHFLFFCNSSFLREWGHCFLLFAIQKIFYVGKQV
jgi:hypothetical protein